MARSIAAIKLQLTETFKAQPELAQANSTSRRAIWNLLLYVVAVGINIFENILDLFKTDIQTIADSSAAATPVWLQDKAFKFQYDATDPQIIQLIDTVPQYPVVDPTKRITTRVSVKTSLANEVMIKVAKNEPPEAFSSAELAAIQSMFNIIGTDGINYLVSSATSDKLFIDAEIYFDAQYAPIILSTITANITSFLSNLATVNFGGAVQVSDIENVIRNSEGVKDVILNQVRARADATAFASGTDLVLNNQVISRLWNTVSGYIVPETTPGNTLADSLTFIPA